jgi:Na+-driven multidrug efflux pump
MQAAHRVAKNTGILYARMLISIVLSLYSTRIILEALGVQDFGIFSLVAGAISMLGFLNASMTISTQRFMSFAEGKGDLEELKSIFNVSSILHFGIALAVSIILIILGFFYFRGILNIPPNRMYAAKAIYYLMIVSTFFTIITVPFDAVLNAHENMFYFAVNGVVESILKLTAALVIINVQDSDRLIIYGFLIMMVSLLVMLSKRIYCKNKYSETKLDFKKYYNKVLFREMSSFAGWNFLPTAILMITNYGMGIILNVFFGSLINAAQGIANQVFSQLTMFSSNLMKALSPVIAKSEGSGDRNRMLRFSSFGAKISFFLSMLFMSPFIIETPFVLKLWLIKIPNYSIIFCRLLLFQALIETILFSLSQSIDAEGNIKNVTIVRSVHNLIYLPFIYGLFYWGFKPVSMYYLMIVKSFLAGVILLYFNKINCGLNIYKYLKDVIFPCFLSLITILLILFLSSYYLIESIVRLFINCFMSLIFSSLSFYYILLNKNEKEILKALSIDIFNKMRMNKIT